MESFTGHGPDLGREALCMRGQQLAVNRVSQSFSELSLGHSLTAVLHDCFRQRRLNSCA
jgi:hypothetical protein